ncbi:MAG: DMT family transporter [Balneolaceae bacterium]
MKYSHHSLLTLFTFFWGANYILAEVALREMRPISFSASRFAIGGVAMLLLLYFQCRIDSHRTGEPFKFFPTIERGDRIRLLAVALLGATFAPWLGIEGLGLTHGARASLWLALGPAVSAIFGVLLVSEKLGRFGYLGIVLAVIGTIILAMDGLRPDQGYWMGDLLLISALVMIVLELHLIKPLARRYGPVRVVALRTAIGGSLYVLIALPYLAGEPWTGFSFWTWFAILAGGAVGVGVGQWIKVRALRSLGPTRVVIYGNLVPIAAILIAWVALQSNPSIHEIAAGLFIILGAVSIQVLDIMDRGEQARPDDEELSVIASAKQE